MKPRTVDVEVIETLTVKKTVIVEIPETLDFDPEERDDDALCEIEQLARTKAYEELAITPDSTWELYDSDGPSFDVGDPKFDYSQMTDDDEYRILASLLTGMEALEIGDVESILREELNNAVIDEMGEDGNFDETFREMVLKMGDGELLSYPGVYEELREHYNNEILEAWAQE
jgi:hypothetical protein